MNGWLNMGLRTAQLFWHRNNANGLSAHENPKLQEVQNQPLAIYKALVQIWALCCKQDHSLPVLSRV